MPGDPFKKSVAIVGVAESECGQGVGLSILQHQALAASRALADAGLSKADVDAVMAVDFLGLPSLQVAEYLGIKPQFTDTTVTGGSAFESLVEHAALAISAGLCEVVLITYGSRLWSDRRRVIEGGGIDPRMPAAQFETPYGDLSPIAAYALAARRHMHEYGTTSEQLAEVAVSTRQWAALNPQALLREPVTISQMENLTTTGAVESGRRAFGIAGVRPAEIDVVQIYDSFTISVVMALEDLGFCQKGEGGRFVAGGRTGPGGQLPVNTSGGGLSYTHPGAFGIFLIIEAVRQLRGECGARQVPGAGLALVHGIGGWLSSQATLILGR
jgi:acetyl-CoA acetyltransferase